MARRAIIAGGSIGGLFAARALMLRGWEVQVLERTPVPLSGRGAGIVTHPELDQALTAVGASTQDVGVPLTERVVYDIAGARVRATDFHQVVTSWDRMHSGLRATLPDRAYLMGQDVAGFAESEDGVAATLADGTQIEGDLLVGADGFRSAIRAQWQPDVVPLYAGYAVWRTVVAEADLPPEIRGDIFKTFGFFLANGTQIIGYPIAGPGNDLRPGHLRYNFVWYKAVPQAELDEMLTDASGTLHEISIPPPLVRPEIVEAAVAQAAQVLPRPFVEILRLGEQPFFTPIYDHLAPVMGQGRLALLGDAACAVRPHLGMGVTKAAQDALALAELLTERSVPEALAAYSAARVAAGRIALEEARRLGRMIFDRDPRQNKDGRTHPDIEDIMLSTAVVPDALRSVL